MCLLFFVFKNMFSTFAIKHFLKGFHNLAIFYFKIIFNYCHLIFATSGGPQTPYRPLPGLKSHQLPVRNKEKVEEKRRNSNKFKKLLKGNLSSKGFVWFFFLFLGSQTGKKNENVKFQLKTLRYWAQFISGVGLKK